MALTYAPPGITVISAGPQILPGQATTGKTLLMLGRAPKGPDYPTLCSYADAVTLFGDPGTTATVGYDLPLAIRLACSQAQPTRNQPFNLLVCRVGVTRATVPILDQTGSPLTAFNIKGIGAYAGSAGNNLQVVVVLSGSAVSTITINDTSSGSPVQKQQYTAARNNLLTNQSIANEINGANPLNNPASIVQVDTVNAGALLPKAQTATLGGGADGQGAAFNDASIATLLTQSLWTYADYIWAGFDAAQIASTISAHQTTALAQNQYRKAILGPKAGTTYASLSGSYSSGFSSDRIVCVAHDAVYGFNFVSNTTVALDGFYAAAAAAGLKAIGPTEETGTKFNLRGFSNVAIPSDLTSPVTADATKMNALANAGLLVFEQPLFDGRLRVRDFISSAPYSLNGGINLFYQFSARDVDDTWNRTMVEACLPFLGRVFPTLTARNQAILSACKAKAAQLGTTIGGSTISVESDPATGQPIVDGQYVMPYPTLNILIRSLFTF